MNVKAILAVVSSAIIYADSVALADITADDVLTSYSADAGYGYVKVTEGVSQFKVDAVKDGNLIEAIYDKATGDVLRFETSTAGDAYLDKVAVEVLQVDEDFYSSPEQQGNATHEADHDGEGQTKERPTLANDSGYETNSGPNTSHGIGTDATGAPQHPGT